MDLDLSPEQEMLREMVRGVCSSYAPLETVRALEDDPVGFPTELWKQMAALDLIGLMLPAEYGGSDMSALEGAVVRSVQLVGLYLVFATLIVPPLATRRMQRRRLAASWAIGAIGYAAGLALSTAIDVPSGPVIVWVLCAVALAWYPATRGSAAE